MENTDAKEKNRNLRTGSEHPVEYEIPNREGNVWPEDICPAYTPRDGAISCLKGCWYCRYADFHLTEERALEVGMCRWPSKVI